MLGWLFFLPKLMFRYLLFVCFSLTALVSVSAGSDSIVSKSSIFVIPHASYQQETSLAPGVAYGYYFKSRDLSRISSISGSAVYTLRNQFLFNATPKLYFRGNKWYLYSNLNIRSYPDYYYGIGSNDTYVQESYTSRVVSLLLQPQYAVAKNLYVGPYLSERVEHVKTKFSSPEAEADIYSRFGTAGWTPYYQTALGVVATFDSRDNSFYPYQGSFAKASYSAAIAGWGSTYTLQEVAVDLRHYFPLFKDHVFALQLQFEGVFGENGIPFQMMPTIGGRDLLRGFREGMYRSNMMMSAQAEYRFPIFWRFKGVLFCATGDVFDSSDFHMSNKMKFAYGVGIRCRVNDARVHVRFDVAKSNYMDKLQFYITATEAF